MDTKINISVGDVSFSGEGDQGWLAEQLDKVLKAAPEIKSRRTPDDIKDKRRDEAGAHGDGEGSFTTTLASYIKEKGGESNQVQRFIATADWLRRRGESKLTTALVTKALKDNHQKRLDNSAKCFARNVSKGYCEKSDGGFYITPEGLKHLGDAA